MLQRIHSLPFSDFGALQASWKNLEEGRITLCEVPDAIRAIFDCEAEVIVQRNDGEEGEEIEKAAQLPAGKGRLYLTAQRVYWMSSEEVKDAAVGGGQGWSVEYPDVMLHAVSRPLTRPSLYLQLELASGKMLNENGEEVAFEFSADDDDDEDEYCDDEDCTKFIEVNLYPGEEDHLDEMFVALSECAALHPSQLDDGDTEEDLARGDLDEKDTSDLDDSNNHGDSHDPCEPSKKMSRSDDSRFEDAVEH